jgi:pimeloyl-ACP methyl ester carboxylesterase
MRWILSLLIACFLPSVAEARLASERMDQGLLRPHLVAVASGRRLSINCVGQGAPTVVFEQGGEGMIFNWAKVQPTISRLTRTCFYDRGGFGWSDAPRYPVTAITVTDDLRSLLRAVGVKGKVVLVGHSIGGFYATMYADRFPEQVAGLVLVDSGFSGQQSGLTGERWDRDQSNIRRGEGQLLRCADLARSHQLTPVNLGENHCTELSEDAVTPVEQAYALHAITGPNWYEAEHSQSGNYFIADHDLSVSHRQEQQAARSFGDMPVVVLSSDLPNWSSWRTDAENTAFHTRWRAGHAALAARSTRGRLTVAAGSGHFIQKDRPEVVIAAIEEVIATVRRPSAVGVH